MEAHLSVHSKARRATEDEVLAVERPAFTETWRPFSHRDVLEAVDKACVHRGLIAERREYGLSGSGAAMFGVWTMRLAEVQRFVPATGEARTLAIGIRNSVDKSMSVGLCAGERVFVCDNMAFSSEFVVFARHSGLLTPMEILYIVEGALDAVLVQFQRFLDWRSGIAGRKIGLSDGALLFEAAHKLKLIPEAEVRRMRGMLGWTGEAARNGHRPGGREFYPQTLGGFYDAATEALGHRQTLSPLGYHERNLDLNTFVGGAAPRLLSGNWTSINTLWEEETRKARARLRAESPSVDIKSEARRRARGTATAA